MPQSTDAAASPPRPPSRPRDEWRRLQRSYAYHPFVSILPLEGEPPTAYQIDYSVRTLRIDEAGQLGYAPTCSVQMTLPDDFPRQPPHVAPLQAIFHPNVDLESVQIFPAWTATSTLVDVVERVGKLLAFQSYDRHNLWNPVAMDWVIANATYVPTDAPADLSPNAGGGPLERIRHSGPATLTALRDQLQEFSQSLLDPSGLPAAADVRDFAQHLRIAVSLFLERDIPEPLLKQAEELDAWAAALPAAETACAAFRKLSASAQTAAASAASLVETVKQLGQHLSTVDQMAGNEPPSDPRLLLKHLPVTADLQKAHGLLRGLLARTEQKLAAAKTSLQSLELRPTPSALPPPLQTLIDTEKTRRASAVHAARAQLQGTLQTGEAMVHRARRKAAALDRILHWRDYADTRERTQRNTKLALDLGAAGVQAYYLTDESGKHGPFEFEQQVDLGAAHIAIHKASQRVLEAIDLKRGASIGRTEGGDLPASVPGERPGESFPTTFHPTPNCDDLALQFDYAVTHTRALMDRLSAAPTIESPASWMEKYAAALARPNVLAAFVAEHRATSATWAALAADLRALAPFKDRLATYHLLLRAQDALPRYLKEQADASTAHARAAERIAHILARSSKDVQSGSMIIPNKYHKEYETLLDQSDRFERDLDRLATAIATVTVQLKARMAAKKGAASSIGSAKSPKLTALPEMPAELGDLSAAMSDWAIVSLVSELEKLLNAQFYFGRRPAAPIEAPPRPVSAQVAPGPVPEMAPVTAVPAVTEAANTEVAHHESPEPLPAPPAEEHTDHAAEEAAPAHADPFAIETDHEHEQEEETDDVFGDWPK